MGKLFCPVLSTEKLLCSPIFFFFSLRERINRRKDGMMGRVGGEYTVKCPLEALGGPSEKKPPSSAAPSQPMTAPVRVEQFL